METFVVDTHALVTQPRPTRPSKPGQPVQLKDVSIHPHEYR